MGKIFGMKLVTAICVLAVVGSVLAGCSGKSSSGSDNTTATDPSVSLVPSVTSVKAGDTFDISVSIVNSSPSRGVQFTISWDPSKVECDSSDAEDYFQSVAAANNGSMYYLPGLPETADNDAGQFPNPKDNNGIEMMIITGAQGPNDTLFGASGSGIAFVLHMTAKSGVSGSVSFKQSNVILIDNTLAANGMDAKVNNCSVNITS